MIHRILYRWLRRYAERHAPDFVIGDDYLIRWWLIPRNRFFNVYLHAICRDDDDRALHDHPWFNVSYILSGAYLEITPAGEFRRQPGDVVLRRPKYVHRLVVADGPVWSLFITGPRVREWGFWCPNGWRHHSEFTAPGNAGQIGRGCD